MKAHAGSLFSSVLGLLACASLFATSAVAAPWQITKFEVHGGAPYDALGWRTAEYFTDSDDLSPSVVREIEDFLGDTARLYESFGFADPVATGALDSAVTGQDGQPVIRVYVYPREGAPLGWYASGPPCSQPETRRLALNVNTLEVMDQGQLTDMAYQTLAHELFHAVQRASASYKGCGFNHWISEGTADAVAFYASRELRSIGFEQQLANVRSIKVYGARPYSDPLNTTDPQELGHGYLTSSFWRYLAEVSFKARGKQPPEGDSPAEDYHYLADLLNTPYGGRADNIMDELGWFSDWISRYPQIPGNLPAVYAGFVTSFADYVGAGLARLTFIPNRMDWEPRWLGRVFGDCPFIGLVDDFTPQEHTVDMKRNAANCFYMSMHPNSTQPDIKIEVTGTDPDALKQLRMSMQDGSFLSAPIISARPGDHAPVYVASWTFPALRTVRMTFIVSNMAENPIRTKAQEVTFNVMAGSFIFTLGNGQQGPLPVPPVYGPEQPEPAPQRTPERLTRREIVEQARADILVDPISGIAPYASSERDIDNGTCDADRLALNLCGSQLNIDLEVFAFRQQRNMLEADVFSSPGGLFGVDVAMMTDPRFIRARAEVTEAIYGLVGRKIRIFIPDIEYGFTGTFDNAVIEVAKANDDRHLYRAYGPGVRRGFRTYSQPPSGRVTIEEYGPSILRGTFEADLIDEADPGPDEAPKIATSISGRFLIPSPWRGDPDFEIDEQAVQRALIQNMLQSGPFAAGPMRDMIGQMGAPPPGVCEAGFTESEIEAMGFTTGCGTGTSSGGSVAPDCSCECDDRETEEALPVCQQQCERDWNTCPMPVGSPNSLTSGDANLEAQVAEFETLLEAKNIPAFMREANVRTFRSLPEPQRLEMLQNYRN